MNRRDFVGGALAIADGRGQIVRVVKVARSSHDACFVMRA